MPQTATPTCPICGDSFSVRVYGPSANASHRSSMPMLLHCGHTFCESCMAKEAQKLNKAIQCPKCKEKTDLKGTPGTVKCLWPDVYLVGSLALHKKHSLDEHMAQLVNAVGHFDAAQAKRKEIKKEETCTCSECCDKPATCRCLQCDNCVMCQGCFQRIHQASRNLRKHQAVPLYESDKFAPVPKVCAAHENRPIEFFCEDDKSLICSHCVIVGNHQNHNISAMDEKNKQAMQDLEPAMTKADLVLQCLKRSDKGLRGVIPQIQKDIFQVFDTVRSHFNHLHSLLQTREMALMTLMDEMIQREVGPIKDMKISIMEEIQRLESVLKDAQRAKQSHDSMMNTQFLLEQLQGAAEQACHLTLDKTGDQVLFDFDNENFAKMVKDYGKLGGSACVKVSLSKLSDVPPEELVLRAPSPSESLHSLTIGTPSTDVSRTVSREPSEVDALELDDRVSVHSETSTKSKASSCRSMKVKTPEIQMGVADLVYLTHIKSPCYFAAQKMADIDKIRSLCLQINKYCNMPSTDKAVPGELAPEDIVLAQFSVDGRWYRGRVGAVTKNTEEPLESRARITFIDYGNSEEIPFKRVRKMEKRFLKTPPFAFVCSLIDLVPTDGSGKWTERASQAMAKMAADKPMLMTVYGEKDGSYLVDLCKPASNSMADDQPISMRDALVFQEFACFSSGHSVPLYPGGPKPKPSRQFLSLAPPKAGDILTGLISHADAPDHLYVQQMNEDTQYLANLMSDLQVTYSQETGDLWTVLVPQKDQICVALYSVDQNWYRAQVIDLPGRRQVVVRYVDFGNSETVPFFKLKKIHNKFLMLPAQAILCKLADVEPVNSSWNDTAAEVMLPFLNKTLVITVEGSEDGKVKVLLYDSSQRDVCLNRVLVQKGHARSTGPGSHEELQLIPQKLTPPEKGRSEPSCLSTRDPPLTSSARASPDRLNRQPSMPTASPIRPNAAAKPAAEKKTEPVSGCNRPRHTEVRVSHVISPGHFYVQVATAPRDGLDNLMMGLQEASVKQAHTQVDWQVGDFCLAQYSTDGRWYRAKILNIPAEATLEVIMVDFGFHDSLSTSCVRQLPGSTNQDTFCICCHFTDIQPAGDITRWSRTACEYLAELLKEATCYIVQKGKMEDGSLPVDLLMREENPGDALNPEMTEYNSVSRKLLTKGLALPLRKGMMSKVRARKTEAHSAPLSKPPRPLILDPMTPAAFYPDATPPKDAAGSTADAQASSTPKKPDVGPMSTPPVPDVEQVKEESVPVRQDVAVAKGDEEPELSQEKQENSIGTTEEEVGSLIADEKCPEESLPQVDHAVAAQPQAGLDGNEAVSAAEAEQNCPPCDSEAVAEPSPEKDTVEITRSEPEQEDPLAFAPPDFPNHEVIRVVPTYVDWEATVFVQYTAEPDSPYGRFGHMLKEYTLETILQDKFLASQNRYRGCIPRDGNCLFRAWAEAVYSNQAKQDELRQEVVRYLSNNWSDFEASIVDTNKEKYLVEMAKGGRYGGEPEIQALCMIHHRHCRIYLGGLGCPVQTRAYGLPPAAKDGHQGEDVELIYISDECYDSGHYDLAVQDLIQVAQMQTIYALWRKVRIKDMPWSFFVDEDTRNFDDSLLQQLVEYLQKYYQDSCSNPDAKYTVGQPVVVLDRDGSYYRARIVDITEDKYKVFLVDFGISDVVSRTQLRDKVILLDIPVQCAGCILSGIAPNSHNGRWTKKTLERLHDLVVNQQCVITVQESFDGGHLMCVSMTLSDGRDVAEHMVALGYAVKEGLQPDDMAGLEPEPRVRQELFVPEHHNQVPVKSTMMVGMPVENVAEIIATRKVGSMYTPMELPALGEVLPVMVTDVHAPDQLCIQRLQLADKTDPHSVAVNQELEKLVEISTRINAEAETYPAVGTIKPGLACCVQYSADLCWYRGDVLVPRTEDNLVGVLFVDYGNSEYVEPSRLRSLPLELLSLPMQSVLCRPSGVMRPANHQDEWMKTIKFRVEGLVVGLTLIARVVSVSPDISVELFRHDVVQANGSLEGVRSVLQPLAEEGLLILHTEARQDGVLIEDEPSLRDEVD